MAVRAWPRILLWALAGGFLAGAGQLGVAYGLSIVRWDRQYGSGNQNVYSAQVTWATWIAAAAVIFGCWVGVWTARRMRRDPRIGGCVLSALAAAAGAAVTVPLTFLPARLPQPAPAAHPARDAALAAALGLAIGVLASAAVLSVPPIAGNVVTTVIWVWLAAFVSLARGDNAPRLAAPAIGSSLVVMVAINVLAAISIAAVARWGGADRLAVAVSGVGGPALVAAAYLVAGTGVSRDNSDQSTPYTAALIAVAAGLAASVAVAFARKPARRAPTEPTPAEPPAPTGPAEPTVPLPAAAQDRTAGDRTAQDRTAGDRTAGDRTAGDRTAQDRTVQLAPVGPHDDEYLDWVKGLGGDSSEGSRTGRRRTRRPERSEPADSDE